MKKGWEKPVCPICDTDKYLKLFYKDITKWEFKGKFNFVKCGKCGMVLQSPRAPLKDVGQYYKNDEYWGFDITKEVKGVDWKKEREKHYDILFKGILGRTQKGKMLDVGCGLGLFLSKFKDLGWEVKGTDLINQIAKFAKKTFSIDVKTGDFLDMNFPKNYFDVVVLSSVLEHVYTPNRTLKKTNSVLKKGGLFVMVIPNINSLGHMIFKRNWSFLEPGRHLYHYSPVTITKILNKHGFKVEKIDHGYRQHNYYGLFVSFRYLFSPKFKKTPEGGLGENKNEQNSFTKEIGKVAGKTFANIGATIEPVIKRSESMIIYAKKN